MAPEDSPGDVADVEHATDDPWLRPRHFLLPFAAIVIVALCVWKTTRTYEDARVIGTGTVLGPAPLFTEVNDDLLPVKLRAFVGRHRMLIAFYDGRAGIERSPLLLRLRRDHAELKRLGWIVLAVGDADPIANRAAVKRAGGFPFEILSDATPKGDRLDYDTVTAWGRFDPDTSRVRPGLFVVDRTGHVAWRDGAPVAEENPEATLDAILEGRRR